MNRLVIFFALFGTVAFALPDISVEEIHDDDDAGLLLRSGAAIADSVEASDTNAYFRSAGGALVKMDSVEATGLKAFRYSYPVTKYSVDDESSEDQEFKFIAPAVQTVSAYSPLIASSSVKSAVAPAVQTYSASPVVLTAENSEEEDESSSSIRFAFPTTPTIKSVGFKPLFTGFKPTTTAVVTGQDVSVAPAVQPYTADTTTTKAAKAVVAPLVYTVPTTTFNHFGGVPTTGLFTGFNRFYTTGNPQAITYSANPTTTTFLTSRPFFYTQRMAPFTTYSNVVNTFPAHTAVDSMELDD